MATAHWEDRVKLAQRAIDRRDNILINKLSGSFDRINRQLNNDIGKIISTYTRKTGLTPEQAFQYLNEGLPQNVRNELLAKIQTVSSARERGKLETIMRTDRYQDRITRMDAIKADTRIALTKNAEVQIGEVTNHLKKTAQESYARSMFDIQKASGYAFSPHGVSADSINKILRTPWSGSTYSSRIWKAKDVMASNLDSVMTEMFSMGKLSDQSLKDLRGSVDLNKWRKKATSKFKNETQYAKYNVQRLIRTETAYVANAADAEAYEECEIEKYEFIAVLDGRTSHVCKEMDGKICDLAEKEEGVNYPPLHPFCRSAVAPSLGSVNRAELQRRARDPETGKNVLIPADMNYNEWKAWVADGSPDIDEWRDEKNPKSFIKLDKTSPFNVKLGEEHYTKIVDIANKSDGIPKEVWGKNQSSVQVANSNYKGVSNYQQGRGISVDIEQDAKGTKYDAPYRTTIHESWHNIDYINSDAGGAGRITDTYSMRYESGAFEKALKQDYKDYREGVKTEMMARTGYKPSNLQLDNRIARSMMEIKPEHQGLVSDLMEGASGGKVQGLFGHGADYWKQPGVLSKEAFASFGDASMCNTAQLEEAVKKFPKSYDLWQKMLKDIL